jgi:hypothetical protein
MNEKGGQRASQMTREEFNRMDFKSLQKRLEDITGQNIDRVISKRISNGVGHVSYLLKPRHDYLEFKLKLR